MSSRDFAHCALLETAFSAVAFVLWVVVVLFVVVSFCSFVCFRNCSVDLIMEMMVMWCWCCEGYPIPSRRFLQILFCSICVFLSRLSIADPGPSSNDRLCTGSHSPAARWVCPTFFSQR